MSASIKLTGRLVAAARALVGVSREDFAKAAGVSEHTIAAIEANGSAWLHTDADAEAARRALETFGVLIVEESHDMDMGAGVRLKFTRQDVRQLQRLEGEGGAVRSDDAP
ncbi:MAG: helix-turn-helix domain-containing protein [Xanthobacteraceae bacterium]|nr:helix-turn-helix domain-containing protein [Xanthobacteraceae bacterium]